VCQALASGFLDSKSRHCRNSGVLRPTQIAIKVLTKPHHRSLAAPSFSLSAPSRCQKREATPCGLIALALYHQGELARPAWPVWFQNSHPKPRVATPQQRSIGLCVPQPALWVSRAKVVPSGCRGAGGPFGYPDFFLHYHCILEAHAFSRTSDYHLSLRIRIRMRMRMRLAPPVDLVKSNHADCDGHLDR
jgi:hypothetical protein